MGKGKLEKFAELETFGNVFQYPYSVIAQRSFDMKGHSKILVTDYREKLLNGPNDVWIAKDGQKIAHLPTK